MSRIFGFYTNDLDKSWYDSSNVKYSECDDHDSAMKTLRVVFKNGTQYEYKNINVQDYLFFRDAVSQGKALNKYIKANGYEYEKLEDANIEALNDELEFRRNGGIFVFYNDGKFTMKDNKDNIICEREVELTEDAFNTTCAALEAVGKQLYTEGKNFVENGKE